MAAGERGSAASGYAQIAHWCTTCPGRAPKSTTTHAQALSKWGRGADGDGGRARQDQPGRHHTGGEGASAVAAGRSGNVRRQWAFPVGCAVNTAVSVVPMR